MHALCPEARLIPTNTAFFQVLVFDRLLVNVGCISLVILRRGWTDCSSVAALLSFAVVVRIELMRFEFREQVRLKKLVTKDNSMVEWAKKPEEKLRLVLTLVHLFAGIRDLVGHTRAHSSWCFVASALHAIGFATYPRSPDPLLHARRPWHRKGVWGQHEDFHVLCTVGDLALLAALRSALSPGQG